MKKLLLALMAVALSLTIAAGCSSGDSQKESTQKTTPHEVLDTEEELKEYEDQLLGAKTYLQHGITSLIEYKTDLGSSDFSEITFREFELAELTRTFEEEPLNAESQPEAVAITSITPEQVVMHSRDHKTHACYFAELNSTTSTRYATSYVEESESCGLEPDPTSGVEWFSTQQEGWKER